MAKRKQDIIAGIHPVLEAFESGKTFNKLLLKKGSTQNLSGIISLAKENDIFVQYVPNERLSKIYSGTHQGVIAFISPVEYYDLSALVISLFEEGKMPFLAILDGLTDVRNFGAIARTAESAGVDALIIPARGSVYISEDAIKTSAGALNKIPVCKVRDLTKTIEYLKQSGISIVSVTEKAENLFFSNTESYCEPIALVMGSEEKGISTDILKKSDGLIKIPMIGTLQSLNVSVAFGVIAYEVVKARFP